jgi:hypothetical protein
LTKSLREGNKCGRRNALMPHPNTNESRAKRLRDLFEGQEAIYVEHGALRVRVSNIRADISEQSIFADIEEIPTAGFPIWLLPALIPQDTQPLHWSIGGGNLTTFSDHTWKSGYGIWSLFFAPRVVDGVVRLAREVPDNLHSSDRYNHILDYLAEADEPPERLFEES